MQSRVTAIALVDDFDPIELLSDVKDHLGFVSQVTARSELSASVRADFDNQIQRIHKRREDPNLYLAVVGEFSSGKSAFINALLRDRLLKSSAQVTTATPTNIRFGPELSVRIKPRSRQDLSFKLKDLLALIFLKRFFHPNEIISRDACTEILREWVSAISGEQTVAGDLRALIHKVTADESVACQIAEITIDYPATLLQA